MADHLTHYVLDADHHAVAEPDLAAWARWFGNTTNRIVGRTEVTSDVTVSTIFLGFDHNFRITGRRGPAVLFETMIFGGPLDEARWRYSSWDDAATGHEAAVRKARAAIHAKARE
jgi:hypothetical protein